MGSEEPLYNQAQPSGPPPQDEEPQQEAYPPPSAPQPVAYEPGPSLPLNKSYQAEPHQAAPYQAAPYQAAPNQAAPNQAAPYQAAPYQAAPYQAAPYQAAPYQAAPYQAAPNQAAPNQAAPYQAAPYQAAPYQAAPYQAAPHQYPPPGVPQAAVYQPPSYPQQPGYQPNNGGYPQGQPGHAATNYNAQQGGQRVPLVKPPPTPWTVGPCDCLQDCGLFCDVFWCAPCMQARIWDASHSRTPDSMNPLVCCALTVSSIYWPAALVLNWFFGCLNRSSIQNNYNVEKCCLLDLAMAVCFPPCAMCQHHVELSSQGVDPGYTCCKPSREIVRAGPPPPAQPGYSTC